MESNNETEPITQQLFSDSKIDLAQIDFSAISTQNELPVKEKKGKMTP